MSNLRELRTSHEFGRDVRRVKRQVKRLEKLKEDIQDDWLLIWTVEQFIAWLVRTGTHQDLFV